MILRTARALNLIVPQSKLVAADEVIDSAIVFSRSPSVCFTTLTIGVNKKPNTRIGRGG